jgi:enamine deaminase RidA (YjgF/YER057c/UK114 family)
MDTPTKRLAEIGILLPIPPKPAADYIPWVRTGNLVYIAGQVPIADGEFRWVGKVGREYGVEEGQTAARECIVNVLAQLRVAVGGDLSRVVKCVKLNGFVNATPDFTQQSHVINAASAVMAAAFGEAGRHARSAVGVASLPFGVAVEIDAVFEVRDV